MSNNTALATAEQNMVAEISPYQARSNELLQAAKKIKVTDEQSVSEAVALKKAITGHRTLVNRTRLDITRQIDTLKKAIMGKESEVLEPLQEAQNYIGEQVITYEAEQERLRQVEIQRVADLVAQVGLNSAYHMKTIDEVNARGKAIKGAYAAMSKDDQENSTIKFAFTEAINVLKDRKTYLQEQAQQAAERERLDAKAARQLAKQRRLDAKQDKLKREKEAMELERKADDDRIAAAREEKNKVKTGARTVTEITITNEAAVPREYCTPDMALIRAAIKDGATVPGVTVNQTKKL